MSTPDWLTYAEAELGVHETPGPVATARILEYWKMAGLDPKLAAPQGDETPWCAAFAGAMLAKAGFVPPHFTLAKQFLGFGHAIPSPVEGAICVLNRPGGASWQGHVGFVQAASARFVTLVSGNAGNRVESANFNIAHVAGYRWPLEIDRGAKVVLSAPPANVPTNPGDR